MSQSFFVFPNMNPVAFSIGPVTLYWYGVMYLLGFLGALWLLNREVKLHRTSLTLDQVSDFLFIVFLGVILGGRIGYVLFYHFDYFLLDPLYLFRIYEGGMSFHGGLLGVICAIFYYSRRLKVSFLALSDLLAPTIPIGLAFFFK